MDLSKKRRRKSIRNKSKIRRISKKRRIFKKRGTKNKKKLSYKTRGGSMMPPPKKIPRVGLGQLIKTPVCPGPCCSGVLGLNCIMLAYARGASPYVTESQLRCMRKNPWKPNICLKGRVPLSERVFYKN